MTSSREMPRYQSHKKVWALKIASIDFAADDSARITPAEVGCNSVITDPGWKTRWHGSDDDLGYYVVYDDGYASWSPSKPFEEGYSLMGNRERATKYHCTHGCDKYQNVYTDNPFANCGTCGARLQKV